MSFSQEDVKKEWANYIRAEAAFFDLQMQLFKYQPLLETEVRLALGSHNRGTALRFLLIAGEPFRRSCFHELIDQASVAHSDFALVREVINLIDHGWIKTNIEAEIWPILETGDEEECRRFAGLLSDMSFSDILVKLVIFCSKSSNPHIYEVFEDYKDCLENAK
jgi:hypothetical protein